MERLTREMTFEEEYTFLKKEVKELFDKEDRESEPPKSHSVVRRALRCIKKLVAEVEQYKAYKDLEEQGLLLRFPCNVGDTVYKPNPITLSEIVEIKIESIFITESKINISGRTTKMKYSFCCSPSDFGKTVFLTQAEAEQKLKEMESD